jgi:hypothetical protein
MESFERIAKDAKPDMINALSRRHVANQKFRDDLSSQAQNLAL